MGQRYIGACKLVILFSKGFKTLKLFLSWIVLLYAGTLHVCVGVSTARELWSHLLLCLERESLISPRTDATPTVATGASPRGLSVGRVCPQHSTHLITKCPGDPARQLSSAFQRRD